MSTSPLAEQGVESIKQNTHSDSTDAGSAPKDTALVLTLASASLGAILILLSTFVAAFGIRTALTSLIVWAVMASLMWHFRRYHGHEHFGQANAVTTLRAVSTAVLAGFVPVAAQIHSSALLWAIAIIATITLCLDGLDGYLARKNQLCSAFGARFDMETDAFLALVITLFLWQSGHVGVWVLGLGLMRYIFLGAAIGFAPLRAPLYPSMRRKTVCVIQVGALCLMLCPWLSPIQATLVGVAALICLSYSFAVDVLWLFRQHGASSEHQKNKTG